MHSNDAGELIEVAVLWLLAQPVGLDNFAGISEAAVIAGGSANGARPKFWAAVHSDGKTVMLGETLHAPKDFTPCLVKFPLARGDKNEPYFEAACLALANQHGVRAARGRLLSYSRGAALAVERFDRTADGGRVFTQSLAALLNDDFRVPKLDYEHLFQVSKVLSGHADTERLYRQACFNVALSIKDDHSKNFAFLMDKNGRWELSPAFDLCPSEGPSGWHTMSVGGEAQCIRREHLLDFAKKMELSESVAKDGIDQARSAATKFESLALSLGAGKSVAKKWARALKGIDARLAPTLVPVDTLSRAKKSSLSRR